jgi:hypothetical protein
MAYVLLFFESQRGVASGRSHYERNALGTSDFLQSALMNDVIKVDYRDYYS